MSLCDIYLPDSNWTVEDLRNVLNQLPQPFLIMGDLNAHNPIWGSERLDASGKKVEKFLEETNLTLLNTGEGTYLNLRSNKLSALDLAFCSPNKAPLLQWICLGDHLTDHFPIKLECASQNTSRLLPRRWKIEKANWPLYKNKVDTIELLPDDVNEATELFTQKIIGAAQDAVPKIGGIRGKKSVPWREQLLVSYCCGILAQPHHPCYPPIPSDEEYDIYERRATITRPAETRLRELLNSFDYDIPRIHNWTPCEIPPWTLNIPEMELQLTEFQKKEMNPSLIIKEFLRMRNGYPESHIIYTDGSKTEAGAGAAFTCSGNSHSWSLSREATVFTTELYAILQALCGERQPRCEFCQRRKTVEHLILRCEEFGEQRQRIGITNDLKQCLANDRNATQKTLSFIREIGIYFEL
ncbi:hypothetical protein JTB14_004844 [Gonioctena quinquepunctata]|nr:hypothetical protein JTB14_004844 [Gonioctena quinquepunctata]